MRLFDQTSSSQEYRLNGEVFYLKFVRRNSSTHAAGIVLALDHFSPLREASGLVGPQGGVRLSYEQLDGHYLRTDTFVGLIRSGYIGCSGTTTQVFATLINAVSEKGQALVGAIQSRRDQ
jgi:hypothetical protein